MERPNLVILMAGGLGTRLRPLTETIPKPLIKVRGKPVLERIVESFLTHGFRRFVLSVGYRGEMIRDHFGDGAQLGAEIAYVWDTVRMGTAGALGLIPAPAAPAFVMNGDIVADVDFAAMLRFHEHAGSLATVAVHEVVTICPYGVVDLAGARIRAIVEKPSRRDLVNAGIYILDPEAWSAVPRGIPASMPDLIGALVDEARATGNRQGVAAFPVWGQWIDIGRLADLERAETELAGAAR